MIAVESFHLARTPLHDGATLIEASAGTGKTFTIAGLFLRLILERELSVRDILVVTFTEAATEELRGRIRDTLASAAEAFAQGRADDPFLQAILAAHTRESATMLARLERALRGFDEAPIHTIHGFCQRTLKDRAFESGALFDMELAADQTKLFQEIADDFWRGRFYESTSLRVAFALRNQLGPESFLPLLEAATRHPSLHFLSCTEGRSLEKIATELEAAVADARELWTADPATIRSQFGKQAKWANAPYNNDAKMAVLFEWLETAFSLQPTPESVGALAAFSTQALKSAVTNRRADAKAPPHRFFDCCADIVRLEGDFLSALNTAFLDFARVELPRRKQDLKLQSFDDLLTRLRAALRGEGGGKLAGDIRARYRAALIDEFQDTDPVQWEIFRTLFSPRSAISQVPSVPAPFLFLIGDPKQAIYGFRGADVFTYLDARQDAGHAYTLDHNWRSESGLVRAVNSVFQFAQQPFVVSGIEFNPVEARGKADETPLTIDGRREAPLQLWFWPREDEEEFVSTTKMAQQLPALVAAEIARLLKGGARLGEQALRPQDIAVLVMKNRQARLVQEALRALDIPSVLHTDASLFDSAEAGELRRVLAAIAQPGHNRLLRAALATELLGVSGTDLDALALDESGWQLRLERFQNHHERWLREGFMPMFRHWLREEHVRQRLLALTDGERRLTNLLHLAEVLHQAALERRLGAGALVQWLAEHIASDEKAAEEHQLRLERDDNAVRLVTIHKSKGLEYPVVFCPFAWRYSEVNPLGRKRPPVQEEVCFHESGAPRRYVRDLGSPDFETNKKRAMAENLAENIRLFYVALTRARHRCYFVWGGFNLAGTSAPAWLLHQPPGAEALAGGVTGLQDAMKAHFRALDDAALLADLRRLEAVSRDERGMPTISVSPVPALEGVLYRPGGEGSGTLEARSFSGRIERDWRIASFSGIAAGQRDEEPDHDAVEVAPALPVEEPASGIFAFPRGTKAGTCLHEIFEKLDFTPGAREKLRPTVEQRLNAHGFPVTPFGGSVSDAIDRTLRVPLDAGRPGFTLSGVTKEERWDELEFYFPLKRLSADLLREVFARCGGGAADGWRRLEFQPVRGFMKGFIDLAFRFEGRFYLVDWKSNWLGNRVEDYGPTALAAEMREKLYTLQYHLYTLALHQFLSLRLPGYDYARDFGGVRYLFLRGIDPRRPEFGVFADRPAPGLIEELSAKLIARGGADRNG